MDKNVVNYKTHVFIVVYILYLHMLEGKIIKIEIFHRIELILSSVYSLRPIDVETMRCLQTRVNIVPVIGKADSLTKKELDALKQNVSLDYLILKSFII